MMHTHAPRIDLQDRARLRERFFGAMRSAQARLFAG
ncbi:isopropylmalate isomerase [Pukyongiella litopenaei]|uniref:Isopropylmalate isomerase n=1 Tax=Pukyongiella litopenaei TaxID=2605946 RepID=A0A2S0MPK5_9RHOB|nr:isopropylmalate isomerase [Pukyongiella litopenaei]